MITSPLTDKQRWLIRHLFLHGRSEYSVTEAAKALGIKRFVIESGIETGQIDTVEGKRSGNRLPWRAVASLALHQWREQAIFDALGKDAERVLPPLLRLETLTVRVPAYMVRMLVWRAQEDGLTLDEEVRSRLHDEATSVRLIYPEIDEALPGFREAHFFPER